MNFESFHNFPKVYNLGHRYLDRLFDGEVYVEEKIDGSQFNFGIFTDENADEFLSTPIVQCKSKGANLVIEAPEAMFKGAVDWVIENAIQLIPGWTYRAEWVPKKKSNVLIYNRAPINGLIIFDISTGLEKYLLHSDKSMEAARLGLECVPLLEVCHQAPEYAHYRALLATDSCLGGTQVEGVVFKNYNQFGKDGHAVMGKYVSEVFKEAHNREWTKESKGSMLERLIQQFRTAARWHKAIQHLREAGTLLQAPQDIGNLIQEINRDLLEEETGTIQKLLFDEFRKDFLRGVTRGFPEFYKDYLLKQSYEREVV